MLSTLSSKFRRAATALLLLVSTAAAQQQYIAFFSAETETYRRIILDGVSNRRVQVRQDTSGGVTVLIWGAREADYVGRRRYEQGYLVPATMEIDFPRKNLMTITVTGNRFADVVRYELVEPALYIIDLYPEPLSQESIFHEQSITALWPNGRFVPDIGTGTIQPEPAPAPVVGGERLGVARALTWELEPYLGLFKKALLWAGGASTGLLILAFVLLGRRRRRKTGQKLSLQDAQAFDQAQAILEHHGNLSYDEATLIADLEHDPDRATA
ncbi:MAG: hypothetical protein IID15_00145 [Candidatus Marinimicrobia bacterium]|nr:hypothetical protein [Candidatus Neomarinimicrobiota bacterium]